MMTSRDKKKGINLSENLQESLADCSHEGKRKESKQGDTKVLHWVRRRHAVLLADDRVGKEKWVSGGQQGG